MVGGAVVTITGKGFRLPGLTNQVEVYHYGGTLMGQMAGAASCCEYVVLGGVCNVTSGSLTSISASYLTPYRID